MPMVQLLVYLAVVVCVLAVGARIWKYSTTPPHLRWELYPVAHEAEKSKYGGSYFEELEWWKSPPKKSLVSELTAMASEIFLLKGVYHHNRNLWFASYPFHLGLYLLVGLIGLLLLGGLAEWAGLSIGADASSIIGRALFYATILVGYAGLTLALFGCTWLLIKRSNDPALRPMTVPADFANLGYILVLLVAALIAWLFTDQTFATSRQIAGALALFRPLPASSAPILLELALFAGFLLYMPFTRMTHLFAKYFTYHQVRWEDSPNLRGGPFEEKMKAALNFGVSWKGPHVRTGKTWAENATGGMPAEGSK
ncbi:MAG: respiratory nitrate reductase subunit gamma [bacterium]